MNFESMQIMPVPPFIRANEMPRYFGISERITWKLLADEEIEGSKKSRHWLINTSSVFKLLKKYKNTRKEG